MDLLNLLNKVKIQTLSFEKHPVAKLDDEIKIHYLNGLSLIMIADENIKDEEKEYLSILINSFGLSDELLDSFIEFAKNPDEKAILEMMKAFMNKEIKYNFMIDAMMIANKDGEYHENEKAVIDNYFEMFKITEDEKKDLIKIFEMFHKQDGNGLFLYFKKTNNRYMDEKLFEYLFKYYNIDFTYELIEYGKEVFDFELFKATFPTDDEDMEIMVKPVNNEQFVEFLNSDYLKNKVVIKKGKIYTILDEDILFDTEKSAIIYQNKKFIVDEDKKQNKATGMNIRMINRFIKFLEEKYNKKYELPKFKERYLYMNDFKYPMYNEFYYSIFENGYYYTYDRCNKSSNDIWFYTPSMIMAPICSDESTHDNYLSDKVGFRLVKVDEGSN